MKVKGWKKQGSAGVITKAETIVKGLTIDNIVLGTRDLSYRQKEKNAPKQLKIVEKTSPNSDVTYTELNFPFPMSNRELVQKRLFVGNKEDPELVKKLGLFDWSHRYYVMLTESCERTEFPVSKKFVRGVNTMSHTLLEEVEGGLKVTFLVCQDLDLPKTAAKALDDHMGVIAVAALLDSYKQAFGK